MSIIRENVTANPWYCPYCCGCKTMDRMTKISHMQWRCASCGAEHDERTPEEIEAEKAKQ